MHYRTLGRTGIEVSLLSLGSGGAKMLGQADGLTQREQTALVRRALDLGVNLFDTSQGYGDSEAILGRALEGVPRDSYFLATKWPPVTAFSGVSSWATFPAASAIILSPHLPK